MGTNVYGSAYGNTLDDPNLPDVDTLKSKYGLKEAGNIDLTNRPTVRNKDGSISTVRSMSFQDEEGGPEILVPTVSDDGRILTNKEAIDLYHKTGKHLGTFDTPEHATEFAQKLHLSQERMYGPDRYDKARERAGAQGAAEFVTELPVMKLLTTPFKAIGGPKFLKDVTPAVLKKIGEKIGTSFAGKLGVTAGAEYLQEGATNILNDAYDNGELGKDKSVGDILRDANYAGLVGLVSGGAVHGLKHLMEHKPADKGQPKPPDATVPPPPAVDPNDLIGQGDGTDETPPPAEPPPPPAGTNRGRVTVEFPSGESGTALTPPVEGAVEPAQALPPGAGIDDAGNVAPAPAQAAPAAVEEPAPAPPAAAEPQVAPEPPPAAPPEPPKHAPTAIVFRAAGANEKLADLAAQVAEFSGKNKKPSDIADVIDSIPDAELEKVSPGFAALAKLRGNAEARETMKRDIQKSVDKLFPTKAAIAEAEVQPSGSQDEPAGDPNAEDWKSFPPESGTLGLPRSEMPQVKSEARGALTQFLKAKGITHTVEEVDPDTLKPTQAEYSPAKIRQAHAYQDGDRAVLISSDNHVVDGHHQALAKAGSNQPIRAIRLNAPIADLLPLVREFPSSELAGAAESGQNQAVQQAPPSPTPDVSPDVAEPKAGAIPLSPEGPAADTQGAVAEAAAPSLPQGPKPKSKGKRSKILKPAKIKAGVPVENLVESVMEQHGLTHDEANAALTALKQRGTLKITPKGIASIKNPEKLTAESLRAAAVEKAPEKAARVAKPLPPAKTAHELAERARRRLYSAVRAAGGIDIKERSDIAGEKGKGVKGNYARLFTSNGIGIDDAQRLLAELGYFDVNGTDDVTGGLEETRQILKALADGNELGTIPMSMRDQYEQMRAQESQDAAIVADKLDMDALEKQRMDLQYQAEGVLDPDVIESLAKQFEDDDDGYFKALQEAFDAQRKQEEDPQGGENDEGDAGGEEPGAQDAAAVQEQGQDRPALELTREQDGVEPPPPALTAEQQPEGFKLEQQVASDEVKDDAARRDVAVRQGSGMFGVTGDVLPSAEAKPEPKPLKSIRVKRPVVNATTGETGEVTQRADEALADVDKHISALKRLMQCLES